MKKTLILLLLASPLYISAMQGDGRQPHPYMVPATFQDGSIGLWWPGWSQSIHPAEPASPASQASTPFRAPATPSSSSDRQGIKRSHKTLQSPDLSQAAEDNQVKRQKYIPQAMEEPQSLVDISNILNEIVEISQSNQGEDFNTLYYNFIKEKSESCKRLFECPTLMNNLLRMTKFCTQKTYNFSCYIAAYIFSKSDDHEWFKSITSPEFKANIAKYYFLINGCRLQGVDPKSYGFSIKELWTYKPLIFAQRLKVSDEGLTLDLSCLDINDLDGLTKIPGTEKVSSLYLANNQIKGLTLDGLVYLNKLRYLHLDDNIVLHIESA